MKTISSLIGAVFLTVSAISQAAEDRSICVFDIIGSAGDQYNIMRDYATAARAEGYNIRLRVFTDERIAAEELSGGQCDAAAITGIRGRQFNSYTGSMDSIGAIPNYDVLRTVINVIASGNERITEHLRGSTYEVMGVVPMGAAYLFVKDQRINNVNALAGKSIAVMEYDEAQGRMAARVGMSPVMSDITNFSGRFNNHSVDISFAPIAAYSALELYRGMEPDGGIVEYTLGQLTMQIIGRRSQFNEEFAAWSRRHFAENAFDQAKRIIDSAYNEVPQRWWIDISEDDILRYDEMMREARIDLTNEGVYNKHMMALLRNVRCRADSGRAECSDSLERY